MNPTLLFLLAGNEPDAAIVAKAAQQAFSQVRMQLIKSVAEARDAPRGPAREFLVLIDPSEHESETAFATNDEAGLPRWPVLLLGSTGGGDFLPREEWNSPALARAFRMALAQHTAGRESVRARGDLKTLGHRFTHDLRAQLSGILSATELLQEIIGSGESPKPSHLQPILESTDATVKLLERISFVTRASAAPRRTETLNMGMAFWAASQRLESQIARRHASVHQPFSWPSVTAVSDWLEVVWWNLLANALQHAGEAPCITVGWEKSGTAHRFWLRDNGTGVPGGKLPQLFHPLHRLHESNAPSGLGLSIVQRLVRLQGGGCGYEPVSEGGSCFYFTLPLKHAESGAS